MSRLFYILPGIIGLVFVTVFATTIISPDSKSFDGTYNVSQVALIQRYDKNNDLTYKTTDNESFTVTGSINLDSNKVEYLQTNGITVEQTFPEFLCILAQVFIPIVFAITLIMGFVRFMYADDNDYVSRTYRHKDDPVTNPKYKSTGPIHRNKNYDRIN